MARNKYYQAYFHDHEVCSETNDWNLHYLVHKDTGKRITADEYTALGKMWDESEEKYYEFIDKNYKWKDSTTTKRGNNEPLIHIFKVDKKGKESDFIIIAPYCEYEEHFRERIKAPKGYYKRAKLREKESV